MLVNGHFVPITQFGSTILHTNGHALILSTLFHTSSLAKNLIMSNNSILIIILQWLFYPHSFCIKDLSIWILILDGGVEDNLYKLLTSIRFMSSS